MLSFGILPEDRRSVTMIIVVKEKASTIRRHETRQKGGREPRAPFPSGALVPRGPLTRAEFVATPTTTTNAGARAERALTTSIPWRHGFSSGASDRNFEPNMHDIPRSSGILAPLFSLPGALDMGMLGRPTRFFLDFLVSAKQTWFQMLPINPIDASGSPYASRSAFAGEPLYIDLEELWQEGLVPETTAKMQSGKQKAAGTFPICVPAKGRVNYKRALKRRSPFWEEAFKRYRAGKGGERYRREEADFREKNAFWLDDFALYEAIADVCGSYDWSTWPEELRRRDPDALRAFALEHEEKLEKTRFLQLVFHVQWNEFRKECAKRGVKLFGDVPIYVGQSSADVWANPDLFMVSTDGRIIREAGSPADDYNPDGQRWGSPTYRWSRHVETNFDWWKRRMTKTLERFDLTRLDHFIGFYNYYSFPGRTTEPGDDDLWAQEQDAARKYVVHSADEYAPGWVPGPQELFFDSIFSVCSPDAFVAEDLGVMNKGVDALRDHYELPGMRVFQFSFDNVKIAEETGRASSPLRAWPESSLAYTGTHDGAPILGWLDDVRRFGGRQWKTLDFNAVKSVLRRYRTNADPLSPVRVSRPVHTFFSRIADVLRLSRPKLGIVTRSPQLPEKVAILHAAVLRAVADTPCRIAVFPIQDVLGLPNDSRINFPGLSRRAWTWRFQREAILEEDVEFIAQIVDETSRRGRAASDKSKTISAVQR